MAQYIVTDLKTRLDKFLVEQLPDFSRSRIQKDIEAGAVSVNGVVQDESKFVVRQNDRVEYEELRIDNGELIIENQRSPVRTLYDDYGLLIIDKPAGLSVHPGAGVRGDTLSDLLLYQFPEMQGVGEAHRPGIVHRLDKDTSGVMLVAKTQEMYEYLKDAFAEPRLAGERKIKKEYVALVCGVPVKAHGFVDTPIGKSKTDFRKYTTKSMIEAKPSLTEYRVLEELPVLGSAPIHGLSAEADKSVFDSEGGVPQAQTRRARYKDRGSIDKMALISVNLHTGRTHQIRVHMHSIGHPLMGDSLYGGKRASISGLNRQFLHARRIEVKLPDGTWIEAEAPLAGDLRVVLEGLGSKMVESL